MNSPHFFKGELVVREIADTWIKTNETWFNKGYVWVNGFNLGRYWESMGPQHALYIPAPLLKEGSNEIIVLELDTPTQDSVVYFDDVPDLSGNIAFCKNLAPYEDQLLNIYECDSSSLNN